MVWKVAFVSKTLLRTSALVNQGRIRHQRSFLNYYDQHCPLRLQLWASMTPHVCPRTCPRPRFGPRARDICG